MCQACSVRVGKKTDLQSGDVGISLDAVINDSFPSLLSWAWCINPEKVKAEFKAKTGLDIADNNLVTIVKAHKLGNDVKVYKVNFLDLIKGITTFTDEERKNAECKIMLTTP